MSPFLPSSALALAALCAFAPAQDIEWWQADVDGAIRQAAEANKTGVLLYFWADDANCKAMFNDTFGDAAVKQAVQGFVCMGAQRGAPAGDTAFARFHIEQVPTVLLLRPDGEILDAVAGYRPVQPFLGELKRIERGEDTVAALREAAEKDQGDALQLRLAKKLRAIGDKAAGDAVLAKLIEADPKGKSEPAAEAQLLKILDTVFVPGTPVAEVDLKPLEQFLVRQKNKRVLFLGYDRVGKVALARNDLKEAASAAQKAWKSIPDDQVLEWGQIVAWEAYKNYEELDKPQLKLALQISAAALKEAEKAAKERGQAFLANALYLHACVQIVNNQRKQAFAGMERAIELDPANEGLKKALDRFKSGSKDLGGGGDEGGE
ncbi:MAG: hypothetical protein AB7O97_04665 [Planctomycetota bacterium]